MTTEELRIIQLLNRYTFNVLIIDNQMWIVTKWVPADGRSYFSHSLTGIWVNELIASKLHNKEGLSQQIAGEIITLIDKSTPVNVDFSSDYKWQMFKSTA